MNQAEMVRRVIGVLTASEEWARDTGAPGTTNVLNQMIGEALPDMEFDLDATAEEIVTRVSADLGPALTQICSAFMAVHNELAAAHDAGNPERPSAKVLQDLALRADTIWPN